MNGAKFKRLKEWKKKTSAPGNDLFNARRGLTLDAPAVGALAAVVHPGLGDVLDTSHDQLDVTAQGAEHEDLRCWLDTPPQKQPGERSSSCHLRRQHQKQWKSGSLKYKRLAR